ncbi:unnamed protein product, partial [Staurois parvus]
SCLSVPPISASQCRLFVHISATYHCASVPPISALPVSAAYQCHILVLPISALYKCCLSVPISNAHQCHLPLPNQCHLSVPIS